MKLDTKAAKNYIAEGSAVRGLPRGNKNFNLRLSDDLLERLQAAARRRDRSQQWVALLALQEWLEADEKGAA